MGIAEKKMIAAVYLTSKLSQSFNQAVLLLVLTIKKRWIPNVLRKVTIIIYY